eukprot:COSAG06_NODE_68002_length_244_cov_3.524138_1_plen_36_part_10
MKSEKTGLFSCLDFKIYNQSSGWHGWPLGGLSSELV